MPPRAAREGRRQYVPWLRWPFPQQVGRGDAAARPELTRFSRGLSAAYRAVRIQREDELGHEHAKVHHRPVRFPGGRSTQLWRVIDPAACLSGGLWVYRMDASLAD